jgi:hypothetical protein
MLQDAVAYNGVVHVTAQEQHFHTGVESAMGRGKVPRGCPSVIATTPRVSISMSFLGTQTASVSVEFQPPMSRVVFFTPRIFCKHQWHLIRLTE